MISTGLRRLITTLFVAVVLLFCLHYLFITFQWRDAILVLRRAQIIWLIGMGSVTVLLYYFLRTLRWYCLLLNQKIHVSFRDLFFFSSVSLAFSIVTPFQSGEMIKVEWLKRRGIAGRASGYGVFAVERAMDLVVVSGAALVSGFADFFGIWEYSSKALLLLALLTVLAGGGWVLWKLKLKGKAGALLDAVRTSLKTPGQWFVVLMLTASAWLMTALGWQVCLISIGVEIGYVKAIALTAWVTLINIMSMVPGAVGVSEVSIAELLILWGYPAPVSQAGALSLRFYSLLVLACGSGLFVLTKVKHTFFSD
jgi:uncharacterized membrane protein YbhN (UPF0104 family)